VAALLGIALAGVLMWPRARAQAPAAPAEPTATAAAGPPAPDEAPLPPPVVAPLPAPSGPCPDGMIHVEGRYCPFVAHRCERFLGAEPEPGRGFYEAGARERRRCERFRDDLICEGRPAELSYCIDRHEFPNLAGVKPAVMVDYEQAKEACRREDKRLCETSEWHLACEGPRTLPYPNGLDRDSGGCNIDRRPRTPSAEALARPFDVSVEVERLDQRLPSGTLGECKSPFGVLDTIGNVAEWVVDPDGSRSEAGRPNVLAGGHWARTPATCRLMDAERSTRFRSYDTGFRCCRDTLDGRPAKVLLPASFRLPKRRKILE
jgi:hypothetical protein